MFKTHMRLVLRNLYRQKIFTLVNLTGLSVGLAGAFLLMLYVSNELRYDRFHEGLDQIYRINTRSFDHRNTYSKAPFVLTTTLKEDLPDDFYLARTFRLGTTRIRQGEDLISEDAVYSTDPELFHILSFRITGGSVEAFDGGPQAAVISEGMARRYFGDENPVGQSLLMENQGVEYNLDVVAVYADVPKYSGFRPGLLISNSIALQQLDKLVISSTPEPFGADFFAESWNMFHFFTSYIRLPENAPVEKVQELMDGYVGMHYDEALGYGFELQNYGDIHFGSGHIVAENGGGSMKTVYIYSAVALLLLLTATLNYILLSIASLGRRRREMGLKMIHGAGRKQVVRQILAETVFFSLVGMLAGLTLTELLLPTISDLLFEKQLSIQYLKDWPFSLAVLVFSLLTGIVAGAFLSRNVLSERALMLVHHPEPGGRGRMGFARILSIVQLSISMALMICTGTIISQLNYFTKVDMGFELEDVVSISLSNGEVSSNVETLQERIAALPAAAEVSGSMWTPPTGNQMNMAVRLPETPDAFVNMQGLMVDYNIVNTLGMRLVEGRDFDPGLGSEEGNVIVNMEAVKQMGLEGRALGTVTNFGTIVGVVEDFHIQSLHSPVPPMLLQFMPPAIRTILVRSRPGEMAALLSQSREVWDEITVGEEFSYTFLEDALKELYAGEYRFGRILSIFSLLNLFISLLGIFGMTRLGTERRTREVGIRKVLGADSNRLLNRFLWEYVLITLAAALPAFPVAFLLMRRWLQSFAYHGDIPVSVFLMSGLISLLVVGLTVIWHIYKAARANPVDAIRYE